MSDTSRTDAQLIHAGTFRIGAVPSDFARQLERELAKVTEQRDRLISTAPIPDEGCDCQSCVLIREIEESK